MAESRLSTKEILNEVKMMLNDPCLTVENFIMPENFEGDFDDEGGFEEERPQMRRPMENDKNDITGIEKELTQIRKIALSVINRLADQPQSPQYDTMKKIWNMVDKAIEQPSKGSVQNSNI